MVYFRSLGVHKFSRSKVFRVFNNLILTFSELLKVFLEY